MKNKSYHLWVAQYLGSTHTPTLHTLSVTKRPSGRIMYSNSVFAVFISRKEAAYALKAARKNNLVTIERKVYS